MGRGEDQRHLEEVYARMEWHTWNARVLTTGTGCEIALAYWHLYSEAEESLNTQLGEKMLWIYQY